jgi:hypothetical protein
MDRVQNRSWNQGFGAGFLVLALSVGGQVASSPALDEPSCGRSRPGSLVSELVARLAGAQGQGIAQRVALKVLDAVLHTCS